LFVRIVLLQHFTITVTNELVKLGDFDLTEQGMLVSRLQRATGSGRAERVNDVNGTTAQAEPFGAAQDRLVEAAFANLSTIPGGREEELLT